MSRIWAIAPVEAKDADLFDRTWAFDRSNGVISIGWSELGDFSKMNREELQEAVASTYPQKPAATKSLIANMLWNFYHEIKPGDIILARRGLKILAGVGTVAASAIYALGKNPDLSPPGYSHANFLSVAWQEKPQNKGYPTPVFQMQTINELTVERYEQLMDGSVSQTMQGELDPSVEDPEEFILEKYLEEFIVDNFKGIFKGDLQVFEDADGESGKQYQTEIGVIDILAIAKKSNDFVVIELKKGRPSDKVVGQILRYMGWVKMNLCNNGQTVRGLIICRDPDSKLTYALAMTNNIDVRYYSIAFKLKEGP